MKTQLSAAYRLCIAVLFFKIMVALNLLTILLTNNMVIYVTEKGFRKTDIFPSLSTDLLLITTYYFVAKLVQSPQRLAGLID